MKKITLISLSLATVVSMASAGEVNNTSSTKEVVNIGALKAKNQKKIDEENKKSLIISSDKRIVLERKTLAGQKVFENDKEYKEYLRTKNEISATEAARVDQLEKNSCDINKLKLAVVKLIHKIKGLELKIKRLKNDNKDILKENKKFKKEAEKALTVTEDLDRFVAPENYTLVCTKKKVLVKNGNKFPKNNIKESYVKFSSPKTFTAMKNLTVYEIPILGAKKTGEKIKRGSSFIADMWTYAGWIHAKGKGWVKGYKLSPRFLQKKVNSKWARKTAGPVYKEVEDCRKVPVTD